LEGGLTKSGRKLRIDNPLGGMAHANELMKKGVILSVRIKNAMLFTVYGIFAKKKLREIISSSNSKFCTLMCLPFSWLLFLHWKRKYL